MSAPTVADHASCSSIRPLCACINTHNGCHRMNAAVAPEPREYRGRLYCDSRECEHCRSRRPIAATVLRTGLGRCAIIWCLLFRGVGLSESGGIRVHSNRAAARGRSSEKRGIIGGPRGGPAGPHLDSASTSRRVSATTSDRRRSASPSLVAGTLQQRRDGAASP